jgi:hypothetical protein
MKICTTGAIATKPTGNVQGGHWFYSLTTGRMIDRMRWTPLPMPADVIERVGTLVKNSPVGLNFTNMRNKAYEDSDDSDSNDDSDDDSDYESDDESNRDDDDDDAFIAGVDRHNADPPDPPDANANENHNNEEDDGDEDNVDDAPPDDDEFPENDTDEDKTLVLPENDTDEDETPVLTVELKKLTDSNGALPPILGSRTRQTAQGTNETLVTTEEEEEWTKPVSKKQRKIQRKLQKQMLKRVEEENKRKLRNKLKNEKRRIKIKERKKDEKAKEEPDEFGDLRDQLRTEQKAGVFFPHDSCSSKDLTPKLEAIALTQYNLKQGL